MLKELKIILNKNNINCSEEQLEKFNIFYNLLIEWNKKINLTTITEEGEVIIKHFFDSLTPSLYFQFSNQKIIDIGAGAGFPSIPLKICYPDIEITLLDSLSKRVKFLEKIIEELKLDSINLIHGRAEDIAHIQYYRQKYDVALSRAVARLNILSELSLPFIRTGGNMISLKGVNAKEEVDEAKKAIRLLGGELEEIKTFPLPNEQGIRNIIFVKKISDTPNIYPRKAGTPSKTPII